MTEIYSDIIDKIKETLLKRGHSPTEVTEAFGTAHEEDVCFLTNLFGTYSHLTEFYSEDDYNELKNISISSNVINFYRKYEPHWLPVLNGGIRLLGLKAIKEENYSLTPGSYLIRFGVLVFATTIGGNAICMDLNVPPGMEPRIIYCESNYCSYNENLKCVEIVQLPKNISEQYGTDEPIVLSYSLLKNCLPVISNSFRSFLESIANSRFIDIEKKYSWNNNNG